MTDNMDETSLQRFYREINQINVTMDNYETVYNKLKDNKILFDSNIENDTRRLDEEKASINNLLQNEDVKSLMENGNVPMEVYSKAATINQLTKAVLSFTQLERITLRQAVDKFFKLLNGIDAISIKREMLQEMREADKSRNDLLKDIIQNKLNIFEEKYNSTILTVVEKLEEKNQNNINTFKQIIDSVNDSNHLIVDKIGLELEEIKHEVSNKKFEKVDNFQEKKPIINEPIDIKKPILKDFVSPVEDESFIKKELKLENERVMSDTEKRKMEETIAMKRREEEEKIKSNTEKIINSPIFHNDDAEALAKHFEEEEKNSIETFSGGW